MVYCVEFNCIVNSSKNRVTRSWLKFTTKPTLFLKRKLQTDETQLALFALRKLVSAAIRATVNSAQ